MISRAKILQIIAISSLFCLADAQTAQAPEVKNVEPANVVSTKDSPQADKKKAETQAVPQENAPLKDQVTKVNMGAFEFTSDPTAVQVSQDGKDICITPCKIADAAPGLGIYVYSRKGFYSILQLIGSDTTKTLSGPQPLLKQYSFEIPTTKDSALFNVSKKDSVESLASKLDTLNIELLKLHSKLEEYFSKYNSEYPKAVGVPETASDLDKKVHAEYLVKYEKLKTKSFNMSAHVISSKIKKYDAQRLTLKEQIFSLEQNEFDIYVTPDAFKSKLLDKASNKYGLKFKLTALNKKIDATYKGTVMLPSKVNASVFKAFNGTSKIESKKAPKGKASLKITYQNKAAKITTPSGVVKRFYLFPELNLTYKGIDYPLDGAFKLPGYILENEVVKKYFENLENSDKRKALIASNKKKYQEDKSREKRDKKLRREYQRLRGDVVEIQRGRFDFKGRNVLMSPFAINKFEITTRHFERIQGTPEKADRYEWSYKGDSLPAHNVTWEESKEFCEDIGGDLPTEAQWEYAARAGTNDFNYWGNQTVSPAAYAVFKENSFDLGDEHREYGPHRIGTKKPNAWGIYDAYGNVSEWTDDVDPYFFITIITAKDPTGATFGYSQIYKGGSWKDDHSMLIATSADYDDPRFWSDAMGFRCVFPAQQVMTQTEISKRLNKYKKRAKKYKDEIFEEEEKSKKLNKKNAPKKKEKSKIEKKKELLKQMKEKKVKERKKTAPVNKPKAKTSSVPKSNIQKVQQLQNSNSAKIAGKKKPKPIVEEKPITQPVEPAVVTQPISEDKTITDKTKAPTAVDPKKP